MQRLVILVTVLFTAAACNKSTDMSSHATIVGYDRRMGRCTGGIYISIDGHPNPNAADGLFDLGEVPNYFHLPDASNFPIPVVIHWKPNPKCNGLYVDVDKIRFR